MDYGWNLSCSRFYFLFLLLPQITRHRIIYLSQACQKLNYKGKKRQNPFGRIFARLFFRYHRITLFVTTIYHCHHGYKCSKLRTTHDFATFIHFFSFYSTILLFLHVPKRPQFRRNHSPPHQKQTFLSFCYPTCLSSSSICMY